MGMEWPVSASALEEAQRSLAGRLDELWELPGESPRIGGVFVCFGRGGEGPGAAGDAGWVAAVVMEGRRLVAEVSMRGAAGAPYRAGLLALREGPMLSAAVQALEVRPEVLIVNATGRDHPRRAGLALHLGAVLGLPTVGVTHRPLLGKGRWPDQVDRGANSPVLIDDEVVAHWLRTRRATAPLVVHPAWRTSPATARDVVLTAAMGSRTPEPLRQARRIARTTRSLA